MKYLQALNKIKEGELKLNKDMLNHIDHEQIIKNNLLGEYVLIVLNAIFYDDYKISVAKNNKENYFIEISHQNNNFAFLGEKDLTFFNSTVTTSETVKMWLIGEFINTLLKSNNLMFFEQYYTNDKTELTNFLNEVSQDMFNSITGYKNPPITSKTQTPWCYFTFDVAPDFTRNLSAIGVIENGNLRNAQQDDFTYAVITKIKKVLDPFNKKDWTLRNNYSQVEQERINNNALVKGYIPTKDDKLLVERVYNSITKKGYAPAIFLFGEAGTGKSEKGKYISQQTGLPYTFFTCSATTNESDLRGKPQNLGTSGAIVNFLNKALKKIWNKEILKENADDGIKYSLTELVLACKYGWIIEIQEPTLVVNAGTLGFMNCMLDTNRTLTLPNGEQLKLHPNTTFIFTTNLTYEGCNLLNNSLLSRMIYVLEINRPSIAEQIKRVKSVTGFTGPDEEIGRVIQAVNEVNAIIIDKEVTQGVSDLRCAISCVEDYMLNDDKDWRQSAYLTIQHKASLDSDIKKSVKAKLDSIFGESDDDYLI